MKKPPLVPGLPWLGNALAMAKQPSMFWVAAAERYGSAFRVRYPTAPGGEMTVLAGLEANQFAARHGHEVFTTKEYYHRLTREVGTPNYICALDGDRHRYFRSVMKPALSREAMAPFLADMIGIVADAARSWHVGEPFAAMPTITRVTLDQLSVASAGCPVNDEVFCALRRYAKTFVGSGVAGQPAIWFKSPFYKQAKAKLDQFLDEQLTEHEAHTPGPARRPDLFDTVLGATYPDGTPLGSEDRRANAHLPYANGFIYAGRICSYMLYAILRHAEVRERVVAEIDAAFANGMPTMRELVRMTALRNCIKETYRYYPIAPAVPRYAAETFEFDGYTIERGSSIFIAIVVPHFDARYFEDPYTFDPDRFAPPRSEGRRAHAYSPYGLGRHVCLSTGMVETVVMTTMIGLLRHLDLAIAPTDYELRSKRDPVPGPEEAFHVEVVGKRSAPAQIRPLVDDDDSALARVLGIDLEAEDIERLSAGMRKETHEPGAIIIRQGDRADRFYVILEGNVDVVRQDPDMPEAVLGHLGAREYFGEIGILHGVPRTATVRVSTDGPTRVLVVDRDLFMHIVGEFDLTSSEIAAMARRRMAVTDLARAMPLLTRVQVDAFGDTLSWHRFRAGERVVRQGDEAHHFYIVTKGRAEVLNEFHPDDPVHLAWLEPGDYFGEIGILNGEPRNATVRVPTDDGPLDVLEMGRDDFQHLLKASAPTGTAIAARVVERLAALATP